MVLGGSAFENPVFLAPMAGVSNPPFRLFCREMGCDAAVTEMVSAKALTYNNPRTLSMLFTYPREHISVDEVLILQLFGSDPAVMAEAARRAEDYPFLCFDINMGCPMRKIVSNREGSALMNEPRLAGQIVAAMARATKKPVTVKFRKAFDKNTIDAAEFAKVLEYNGAAALTVHGRTREQMYAGTSDPDTIRRVKRAVNIPVIGNGDVCSGETARAMFEQTGCDGVMVGRAAHGDPWVFTRINAYLRGAEAPETGYFERVNIAIRHAGMLSDLIGERAALAEMRGHFAHYIKNFKHASRARAAINEAGTCAEAGQILMELIKNID